MKKLFILFFVLFSVNLFYAHPPTDIKIEYDNSKKIIMTYVSHSLKTSPVQDPKKHYIKYIVLKIDGKIIKKNSYDMQETIDGQKAVFVNMDVKKGSKIAVQAACNLVGKKTSGIIVK